MKSFKSDDQIYKEMRKALHSVLAEYMGSGAANDTEYLNDEFSDRLYSLAEYSGAVIRYFELRRAAADHMTDEEIFKLFEKMEAER